MLWCDELGGLLEPAQEKRKARGKSVPIGPNAAEKATHELTPTSLQLLRASQSRRRSTSQTTTQRNRVPDHHGRLLFCAGRTRQGVVHHPGWQQSVWRKGASYTRSLGGRRTLESMVRIGGEPAIRALGVAIQYARSEETVIECRPKYSSPSMGPVENMNKELCGLSHLLARECEVGDHD